ncbi:hypothetical protein SO694_001000102 [Aureococcus anophagefferens]|uniref:Ricin B lectin domain-containing protein n=1 Tax=Aureococcus anophagefferens TaxID=44056 RepID=A0ABR1FMY5_AURAN
MMASAPHHVLLLLTLSTAFDACSYDGRVSWDGPKAFLALLPCDATDPHSQWAGATLSDGAAASEITNGAACLSTISDEPARVVSPCDATRWSLRANQTLAVTAAAAGTLVGKGVGACLDLRGGGGPTVELWTCHPAGDADAPNQQWTYEADGTIRSPKNPGKCVTLNRTAMNPYVATPCAWPNKPPSTAPPRSDALRGVALLEDATPIPLYGADTFYPAEDRDGNFYSGFDDGGLGGGGTSSVSVSSSSPTGFGLGRYTSANLFVNGTWWTGSYGLGLSSKTNSLSIEIGPFVGFRHSVDGGATWKKPMSGGAELNVSRNLWGERAADAPPRGPPIDGEPLGSPAGVKMGSPHVVDHGPENVRSPDGKVYVVAGGCLAPRANENCTWISGDGIFLARASFDAADPDSLNDASNWEFMGVDGWVGDVDDAKPVFEWEGRVGAVTATWAPALQRYLFCVTAPTTHAWANEGPYDTFVLEAPRLTGPFSLVTYMPKFGMQAYFVSAPSAWMADTLNDGDFDAVLTFSANFACNIEGCAPNVKHATYGANVLPVRFLGA